MKWFISLGMACLMGFSLLGCQEAEVVEVVEKVEEEKVIVDYDAVPFEEWVYTSSDYELLSRINSVPYGSAGCSLYELNAAIDMICLLDGENVLESVSEFLAEMTPLQRDYFSFSWVRVSELAMVFFSDFDSIQYRLGDIGRMDFDMSGYEESDFLLLNDCVLDLFDAYDIEMVWKSCPDTFPIYK